MGVAVGAAVAVGAGVAVGSGVAVGMGVMVGTGVSAATTLWVGTGIIIGTGVAAEEVGAVVATMTRGVGVEVGPIVLMGVTLGVSAPQARIIIRNPTSTKTNFIGSPLTVRLSVSTTSCRSRPS